MSAVAAPVTRARAGVLACVALAVLLPLLGQLLAGDRQLNVSDEGYLWYGVQRVAAGEVPLRDFQSYHPGRYHWCAALAPLFGTGLIGVRASGAVFAGLGLLCALLVTRRIARGLGWTLLFALLFALCAFPRHKPFEPAFASMAAWFAVRLVERPSALRHFTTGVFVGLAGYFGSNLGLYAGLGSAALIALLAWKEREPGRLRRAGARVGACAGGVVLGFAPFLAMLVFVPGFAAGFADSVRLVLEHGTNVAKPWPWPWRVPSGPSPLRVRDWTEALVFLAPVLMLPLLALVVLRARATELRTHAACLAPAVVAPFFLHHVAVNSGAWHLAQCMQPFLLALLGLPLALGARPGRRALAWGGTALVFLAFALVWNPLFDDLGERSVAVDLGGESIRLPSGQARYFMDIRDTVEKRVGDGRLFLAPNMPALYCLLGKRAPCWWIYFYFPMSPAEQSELIRTLDEQHVDWALIADPPPEARVEKTFRKTHPLVWEHFTKDWRRVSAPHLPADLALFRRG